MKPLEGKIIQWAKDKGIAHYGNRFNQLEKSREELNEMCEAIKSGDKQEIKLEIGDVLVTIVILAHQYNLSLETCLHAAYEKIKNRTGKTKNGFFIKD